MSLRGVSNTVRTQLGGTCVAVVGGGMMMHWWFADNWDLSHLVRILKWWCGSNATLS